MNLDSRRAGWLVDQEEQEESSEVSDSSDSDSDSVSEDESSEIEVPEVIDESKTRVQNEPSQNKGIPNQNRPHHGQQSIIPKANARLPHPASGQEPKREPQLTQLIEEEEKVPNTSY